jgi:hypothetical protein
MKTLDGSCSRPARLLVIAALAAFGLFSLNILAGTVALATPATAPPPTATPATAAPATAAPANTASAPMAQTQTSPTPVNQDIRDIRPPYHIPPGWLWLAWTAGGLALVGLAYGAWRWHRRLSVRAKLPYELALERLEAARPLMHPEQARAFSIAVSEVVRDYIETGFPVRAAHRTTNEFLRDLATRSDSPLVAHQPVLTEFLHHCDLAKFARWVLSVPQMQAMLQSAGAFIVATGKPVADIAPTHSVDAPSPASAPGAAESAPTTLNAQLS